MEVGYCRLVTIANAYPQEFRGGRLSAPARY
jgi:hypothetical protein